MADIPTYEQWMKDTAVFGRTRSDFLKAVDEAIKAYNLSRSDAKKNVVKTAFDRWRFEQSKQGKDWRKNDRNDKGALTNLHRALTDVDKRKLTPEEKAALDYIAHAQAMALQRQFMGKNIRFKATTLAGMANRAGSNWQKFKTSASALKDARSTGQSLKDGVSQLYAGAKDISKMGLHGVKMAGQQSARADVAKQFDSIRANIISFCKVLCPDVDPNHVFSALHLGSIESFAADLAPVVGVLSSGGKAIAGWAGVAMKAWSAIKIADTRFAIAKGDPEAAFDALLELLDREIAAASAKAGVSTAAFTGKALGAFLDAGAATGPAVGLMEVLAEIFQTIFEYVRDYRESKAGNEMLRLGALNLDLFKVCPILGCYFLVIQDHSTIINFAVSDYGTENFVLDVERLIKKIDPVLAKSRQFISVSRLEIPNMSHAKGVVEQNYSVKTGFAKVTGLPAHVKGKVSDAIDSVFEKHGTPPKVDKSRIVGFGSGS